jgi:hypothetical protein
VIPSKSTSMENGAPPRDMLSRRVRTAEYYLINDISGCAWVELYDESKVMHYFIGMRMLSCALHRCDWHADVVLCIASL